MGMGVFTEMKGIAADTMEGQVASHRRPKRSRSTRSLAGRRLQEAEAPQGHERPRRDQGDGTKHPPLRPIGDHNLKACRMLFQSLDDKFVVSKKSMRAFSIFVLLVRDPDGKRRALESPGETWRAFSFFVNVVRSVSSD